MARQTGREVIFEFQTIGGSVKVSAIDARTGTEVSIVGPSGIGDESLKRTALQKLEYVMNKKASESRR